MPIQAKSVPALDEKGKDTDGGGGGDDALAGGKARGGHVLVGAAGGRGAAVGPGSSVRRRSSGGRARGGASIVGAAGRGLGGVLFTALSANIGLAGLLVAAEADVLGVARVEELLADKGGHGLGIVLEGRGAAVGAADALVLESFLDWVSDAEERRADIVGRGGLQKSNRWSCRSYRRAESSWCTRHRTTGLEAC